VKYCEIIANRLSKAGWSWGCVATVDREGRTIFITDAHRGDGKRFVVCANEKLRAFLELEAAIRPPQRRTELVTKPTLTTQFAPQGGQSEESESEQRNCRPAIGHPSPSDYEREVLVR
jgi:hypothetical protein